MGRAIPGQVVLGYKKKLTEEDPVNHQAPWIGDRPTSVTAELPWLRVSLLV